MSPDAVSNAGERMTASRPGPPATGASATPGRSGEPGEPPDRLSRVRVVAASRVGRALLATLGLKLVVATLGPAAPGWLRVIDSVGAIVIAVGLGYLLFRLLATLIPLQRGKVEIFGHSLATAVRRARYDMGVVFQSP